ncbi:MAG TPA: MFS transporter [Gaiellaceae bacterium]|nr:MFS transporter [Gaiellaceae bacterium]
MRTRVPRLLLENANFRRYFAGQSVSLLGDQITAIALPLTAVLTLHATAGEMGALTSVYLVPNLLFALHAGVWIDRLGRRRLAMFGADLGRAFLTATIPIAYAVGHLTWTQLYIVAFLLGSLSLVFYVAYGSVFQTIVAREDYVEANSILNGTRGASFLFGNSLGGTLVQLLRGPYALAVDAVSFVWSAAFLRRIDAEEPPGAPRQSGGVGAGLRWIRDNAIIRAELLGVATLNLFNFMFFALFMLYATRYLHVRPATLGVVLGSAAVGTLGAAYFTGRLARRVGLGPAFIIGCFGFPAPLILVPAARGPYWLVLVFLFVAELLSGIGLMVLDILAGTISAATVPPAVRSRVSGAFQFVNYGVRPVGTALGGALGTTIGVHTTLWIATVGALAGLLFLVPSPIRTLRDVPQTAGA